MWSLLTLAAAAPSEDAVTALPGWEGPLPSKWYSGFLKVAYPGATKFLHYVYVETTSAAGPAASPVTLWMNGGPGCSSLDGAFYEHGQLLVSDEGTLVQNPYAWTTASNMLYLEAPAGVGFSYQTEPATYSSDDNTTAHDNLLALHAFFAKFPELKDNEFFVSGESYGGVYVPTLSQAIMQDSTVDWNMQGLLVGNGVMGFDLMARSQVPFLFRHGALSDHQYAAWTKACADPDSQPCSDIEEEIQTRSVGLNMYDFYRDCHANPSLKTSVAASLRSVAGFQALRAAPRPAHPVLGMNVPCINSTAGTEWLDRSDVRKALHVDNSPNQWAICTTQVNYQRNVHYKASTIYKELVQQYRVLIYHGDTDMACDYIQGQMAMDETGFDIGPTNWEPWSVTNTEGPQTSGWLTTYDVKPNKGSLSFITIKGAGHMAPQWKPVESLAFFTRFLDGKIGGTEKVLYA